MEGEVKKQRRTNGVCAKGRGACISKKEEKIAKG